VEKLTAAVGDLGGQLDTLETRVDERAEQLETRVDKRAEQLETRVDGVEKEVARIDDLEAHILDLKQQLAQVRVTIDTVDDCLEDGHFGSKCFDVGSDAENESFAENLSDAAADKKSFAENLSEDAAENKSFAEDAQLGGNKENARNENIHPDNKEAKPVYRVRFHDKSNGARVYSIEKNHVKLVALKRCMFCRIASP
jgi:ribosomal protein L29